MTDDKRLMASDLTPDWQNASEAEAVIRQISWRVLSGVMPKSVMPQSVNPKCFDVFFTIHLTPQMISSFERAVENAIDGAGNHLGLSIGMAAHPRQPAPPTNT